MKAARPFFRRAFGWGTLLALSSLLASCGGGSNPSWGAAASASGPPPAQAPSAAAPAAEADPAGSFPDSLRPTPADLAAILAADPAGWRRPEWELYAWSRIPSVLIFDFRDYETQARFFRRLGFFVAVKGESGRIAEEPYYAGRHVYNAHDYSPEDLARFFRLAAESGVRLNPEEALLRRIALLNGVLRLPDGGEDAARRILPGLGAVLSVSRETPASLRRRLLAHETAHGLFYADAGFRQGCFALWEELSPEEQAFWRLFLGHKGRLDGRSGYDGYDTDNLYLTVNELQAHVLQLERGQVPGYFAQTYLPRLKELLPEREAELDRLEQEHPFMFEQARLRLEALLEQALGVREGDLVGAR